MISSSIVLGCQLYEGVHLKAYICEALGADEYVNPIAGRGLFDVSDFRERNVELLFSDFSGFEYAVLPNQYEAGLSILDVMMWNSPGEILSGLKLGGKLIK